MTSAPFRNAEIAIGFALEDATGSMWDASPGSYSFATDAKLIPARRDTVRAARTKVPIDAAQHSIDTGPGFEVVGPTTGEMQFYLNPNITNAALLTDLMKWMFGWEQAPYSSYTLGKFRSASTWAYGKNGLLEKRIHSAVVTESTIEWQAGGGEDGGYLSATCSVLAHSEGDPEAFAEIADGKFLYFAQQPFGRPDFRFTIGSTDYARDITQVSLKTQRGIAVDQLTRGGSATVADARDAYGLRSMALGVGFVPKDVLTDTDVLDALLASDDPISMKWTKGEKSLEFILRNPEWPPQKPGYDGREGLTPFTAEVPIRASAYGEQNALQVKVDSTVITVD